MQIFQIVATIISVLLGASQVAREVSPLIQKPPYVYRGHDEHYRYWSDPAGRYWCRMDRNGLFQYAENPAHGLAAQPGLTR
jgi:hypothetical protein